MKKPNKSANFKQPAVKTNTMKTANPFSRSMVQSSVSGANKNVLSS